MSATTGIQWTDVTWNPTTGCTPVSPGCKHCYAKTMHKRLTAMGLAKYSRPFDEVVFHYDALTLPIRWREPRRIFVDSMSDLYHQAVTTRQIAQVYAVMRACQRHTFQVVTKRPDRAADLARNLVSPHQTWSELVDDEGDALAGQMGWCHADGDESWPLSNVHLLTSCEDQRRADERIPLLLQCPAAVRGVSLEPLLGPIDLGAEYLATKLGSYPFPMLESEHRTKLIDLLDWVIVGCESGPGRRPCELDWIRDIVRQCRRAGVPCFVKQVSLGGKVSSTPWQWPLELRVRMFPAERWE